MKRYAHLFFDLDHTLWDFETNSRHTLRELHEAEKGSKMWRSSSTRTKR